MRKRVSNKKVDHIQFKIMLPPATRDALRGAADATGYPMSRILQALIDNHLSTLDMDKELRTHLRNFAKKNRVELKLTLKQKKVLQDVTGDRFTDDLL